MIALVISTWLLSSPARRPHREADAPHSDLPGYYLKNAVLTDFDAAGNPGVRIEAERIDQVDHASEVALYNVRVAYQAQAGQIWTMVGDQARVETGSKIVDVFGNVRLVGDPDGRGGNAVIHTDTLRYDMASSVASTKSDVRVDFGGQHAHRARHDGGFERAHFAPRIEGQWPIPSLSCAAAGQARSLPARLRSRSPRPACPRRPRRRCACPSATRRSRRRRRSSEMDYKNNHVLFNKVRIQQGTMAIAADQAQGTGLDFANGHWVFRGAVKITMDQGQLTSDEAEVTFVKNALVKAVANGKPAAFEQRIPRPANWRKAMPNPSTMTWPRAWCG